MLLEEVVLNLKRAEGRAHLTLRGRGGAFTTLDVAVSKFWSWPRTGSETDLEWLRQGMIGIRVEKIADAFQSAKGRLGRVGRAVHPWGDAASARPKSFSFSMQPRSELHGLGP